MNSSLIWGIPTLTEKGRSVVNRRAPESALVNGRLLAAIDGKKTICDLRKELHFATDLDMVIEDFVERGFVVIDKSPVDQLKEMFTKTLGCHQAQILITKLDMIYLRRKTIDEYLRRQLELTAMLFFGKEAAQVLSKNIAEILDRKQSGVIGCDNVTKQEYEEAPATI
jgi:hypothetical protein